MIERKGAGTRIQISILYLRLKPQTYTLLALISFFELGLAIPYRSCLSLELLLPLLWVGRSVFV